MALDRRDVERALTGKLLMELDDDRDHRFFRLMVEGKLVAQTKVSTGTTYRTLGHDLVKAMARQLYVPAPFFRELVSCSKGRDEYLQRLVNDGVI